MNIGQIIFAGFIVLLVASLDVFALGFGYGTKKVKVPVKSISIISVISSLFLLCALLLGYFIGEWLPEDIVKWFGFGVLLTVGISRIVLWLINRKKERKEFQIITMKELALLAIVLAIDGMAIGVGTAVGSMTLAFIFSVFAISIISDILIFKLGHITGEALSNRTVYDLGWVGGVLLVLVAVAGLFI